MKFDNFDNLSNFYDEMKIRRENGNFQFEGDPFSKNAQSISKIYHGIFLVQKVLQVKHQVKDMNIY